MAGEQHDRTRLGNAQIAAGFLLLIFAIVLILLDVLDEVAFGVRIDIGVYGWATLVTSVYVIFGFSLPDLLEGRRQRKDRDDE